MLIIAWALYFFISFLIALAFRKLVKFYLLKKFIFALVLSSFITVWFSFPGEKELSPIISIFIMDFIQNESSNFQRLARPFFMSFLAIFFIDLFLKK